MISTDLVTNSFLSSFSPFLQTKNKNQRFSKWVTLYFKAMPNSIDFYKGIFLHVIPVRTIVLWFLKSPKTYHFRRLYCVMRRNIKGILSDAMNV